MKHYSKLRINFDLNDCDKILKTEGENIKTDTVKEIYNKENFNEIIKTKIILDIKTDFDEALRGIKGV